MTERKKSLSPRLQAAIEVLATSPGITITAAAARAGISREAVSQRLGKAHVRAHLQKRIAETLGYGAARASQRMLELVEEPGVCGFQAARFVLGAGAGITAPVAGPTTTVNIHGNNVRAGFVIDLRDDPPALDGDGTLIDGTVEYAQLEDLKPDRD